LKVLIANDTYPPQLNGAAVAAHRLVQGLARRGHQVCVVAPNMAYRDEVQDEPSSPGVTIHRIKSFPTRPLHPEFRITSWARIDAKLDRIFHRFQPDIVHIQNQFVVGQGCLKQGRKFGVPVVGTNHFMPENLLDYFPKPLRPAGSAVMWKHCLRVYNRLDCVLAPSYAALKVLREAGLTAPARVISNGIDLQRYSRAPAPEGIFEKYGIRPEVPTFLAVGRLDKDKQVDLIIRSTAVAAASAQLQTVVVGRGKDEAEFRQLARRLGPEGAVVFTGYVPDEDLPLLYNVADVYIGAGAAELQGLAVMEGMASGLPILVANAVALPELLEEGVNGFLFEPTVEDLARKMLLMLDHRDRWESMGEHGMASMQRHDMPAVLAQVEELYRRMIAVQEGKLAGRR
jgi:glycosyltransferase involved in cell wall biosynthesis